MIYQLDLKLWFKTSKLRSDLLDFSDAYIVVKGEISVKGTDNDNKKKS